MRIKLLIPMGSSPVGTVLEVGYTQGANLCYYKAAEQLPDEPEVADKGLDSPPMDKQIHKDRPKRKYTRRSKQVANAQEVI